MARTRQLIEGEWRTDVQGLTKSPATPECHFVHYIGYVGPAQCRSAWIAFFLVAKATNRAQAEEIHVDDFASIEGLSLVGDAGVSGAVLASRRPGRVAFPVGNRVQRPD
jgi:hypothetical protein